MFVRLFGVTEESQAFLGAFDEETGKKLVEEMLKEFSYTGKGIETCIVEPIGYSRASRMFGAYTKLAWNDAKYQYYALKFNGNKKWFLSRCRINDDDFQVSEQLSADGWLSLTPPVKAGTNEPYWGPDYLALEDYFDKNGEESFFDLLCLFAKHTRTLDYTFVRNIQSENEKAKWDELLATAGEKVTKTE